MRCYEAGTTKTTRFVVINLRLWNNPPLASKHLSFEGHKFFFIPKYIFMYKRVFFLREKNKSGTCEWFSKSNT